MVKTLIVNKILSDDEIENKEGEYFDEDHYKGKNRYILKHGDYDVYKESIKDENLLLKIRRNVIPKNLTDLGLESFLEASKKKHENRGAASGILDRNKMPNYIGEFVNPGKFRTGFISNTSNILSKQATSNLSQSNIVGYFDVPDRNLKGKGAPCRLTAFNKKNPELWKKSLPFIKYCDNLFKELVPKRHKIQKYKASLTPNFTIPNTAYSTITINYSWRTGLHKDAGDLKEGFGNLIVIEDPNNKNTYDGCYLGFPQYGVCVDTRTGDYLAMNVHEWHCNTEFINNNNGKIFGDNKKIDTENDWIYNRLSMVMYLREKMIKCRDKSLWKNKLGGYLNIQDNNPNNKMKYLNIVDLKTQKNVNIYSNNGLNIIKNYVYQLGGNWNKNTKRKEKKKIIQIEKQKQEEDIYNKIDIYNDNYYYNIDRKEQKHSIKDFQNTIISSSRPEIHEPIYIRQKGGQDCSIACLAMVLSIIYPKSKPDELYNYALETSIEGGVYFNCKRDGAEPWGISPGNGLARFYRTYMQLNAEYMKNQNKIDMIHELDNGNVILIAYPINHLILIFDYFYEFHDEIWNDYILKFKVKCPDNIRKSDVWDIELDNDIGFNRNYIRILL